MASKKGSKKSWEKCKEGQNIRENYKQSQEEARLSGIRIPLWNPLVAADDAVGCAAGVQTGHPPEWYAIIQTTQSGQAFGTAVKTPVEEAHPTAWASVLALLLTPASCYLAPWEAADNGPSPWVSVTCRRHLERVPHSWLPTGRVPVVAGIWELKQHMKNSIYPHPLPLSQIHWLKTL